MKAKCSLLLLVALSYCLIAPKVTAQSAVSSLYSGVVPGSPPKYWLETMTYEDQSSSRLLVFQTIPGVEYRVESSMDLTTWEEVSSLHGGGQQEVVPMVEIEAPPTPQPPPANAGPAGTHVWLVMQKATAGGIVVYWFSLDLADSRRFFQSHHFPNLTLDAAWDGAFVYVRRFGDYSFVLSHPPSPSMAPPNTEHYAEDQAMLEAFEENFETMNQEVRDQIPGVRLIPAPAPPPNPNGKKFFRVWADWSRDSDGDNVPDWEEFAMMNGVKGVGADGTLLTGGAPDPLANPASADANGNGVPDGDELDFDEDGIPNSQDADSKDGVIAWRKTLTARYALFDVPLRTPSSGYPIWPVDVNSKGMVLFRDGIDWGDSFKPLPDPDDGAAIQAMAINDHGTILGTAVYHINDPALYVGGVSIWNTPSSKPYLVDSETAYPASPKIGDGFVSSFSNDGSFIAPSFSIDPVDYLGDYYWSRSPTGEYSEVPAEGFWYCSDEGVRWGWDDNYHQILVAPSGGGDLGATDLRNYIVVDGLVPVLHGGNSPSLFRVKNAWQASPTLGRVMSMSDSGIAHVATAPSGHKIPAELGFWMNGRFLHPQTMIPDLPQTYQDWEKVAIPGMADKGHIVLTMDSGHPSAASACAVGFPCAVEEDVSDAVRLAYRDNEEDAVPFTGVDDISITADKPDAAAENKIWIMAPIGSGSMPNDVKFHIPVSTDNPMTLSGPNLEEEATLTVPGQSLAMRGTGGATSDEDLVLQLATSTALNAPIGIKAMKRRLVRVTLTPVGRPAVVNDQPKVLYPKRVPNEQRLEKYLNKVFELQLNAEIKLTVRPQIELDFSQTGPEDLDLDPNQPVDGSIASNLPVPGGGVLDVFAGSARSPDENAFIPLRDPDADINVYFVGGISTIRGWGIKEISPEGYKTWRVVLANGYAEVASREAWVSDFRLDAPFLDDDLNERLQMNTIAHEIGHVIVGPGHPDQGGGKAPLPGTNHNERLMRSGGLNKIVPGYRLVKGEWDEAEVWLQGVPYPPIQPITSTQ